MATRNKKKYTKVSRGGRWKKLRKYLLLSFLALALAAGGALYLISTTLPDVSAILEENKTPVITIKDSKQRVLAKYGDLHGSTLRYDRIPKHLINALLATEDRRFFKHFGIDGIGLLRAAYVNHQAGKVVQGASTITQQLAKISLLNPQRTWHRKIQEAMLALQIERKFSKQEILEMYLNRVYLGRGNFGIDAASRFYFGKPATEINLHEAAILVGMLKAPNRFSPANNKTLAFERAKQILYSMETQGYISIADLKNLSSANIIERGAQRGALLEAYFADYIIEILPSLIGTVEQSLTIHTTLDLELQNKLEKALQENLSRYHRSSHVSQAAAVSLDQHGAIKAWVGGASYGSSQFDRVYQARRQPGSSFKIFAYLSALQHNINLSDTFVDQPISINGWRPRNFSRNYQGKMTLLDAFAQSNNIIAVQLSEKIGRPKVIKLAHQLGINNYLPDVPSIALGSAEVSLLDMTTSYGVIAANGHNITPFAITKITDQRGLTIYTHSALPLSRVLSENVVRAARQLLAASVNQGTSTRAALPYTQVYGKTGTTQDHRDAWFFGFAGGLTTGVWVGNDNDSPMRGVTGGQLPAIIWKAYMMQTGATKETNKSAEYQKDKKSFWQTLLKP